jgi:hypothetical protein
MAKFGGKPKKEEGKISIGKGNGSVVNNGCSVVLRSKGVVIWLLVVVKTKLRACIQEGEHLFVLVIWKQE